MNRCELPPCPPCPRPTPPPCPQVCEPPPPPPPCRVKPIMRGLHWQQTKGVLAKALALSALGGFCVYFFIGRPRMHAYKDFYAKAEVDEWAEEMAAKGLFQSVPPEMIAEEKATKKK